MWLVSAVTFHCLREEISGADTHGRRFGVDPPDGAFTLAAAGHDVVQAVDGEDGLSKAKAQGFKLVITDLHMPKMNGIALIKELRKTPEYKFTPILMLTTEAAAEMKAEGKGAGATGWLVKPFNPEQLVATVARVLA